jgi:hypothetical protein
MARVFFAASLLVVLASAASDPVLDSAFDLAEKAVAPVLNGQPDPTLSSKDASKDKEALRQKKIADKSVVEAYNEFQAGAAHPTPSSHKSKADVDFDTRFMNLFKPTLFMPRPLGGSIPNADAAKAAEQLSMFAPAPPPPSLDGKPPPAPLCLPPGEPRRLWAREQVQQVDAKHRSTPTQACAYECALRCSPCSKKEASVAGMLGDKLFGATSLLEVHQRTIKQVIDDGSDDMAKCELDCMPGCMKDPAVAPSKTGASSFLEVEEGAKAPKLSPKEQLLMRARLMAKFNKKGGDSQLKSNTGSRKSSIVKPEYADQRGIDDGAHRFASAHTSAGAGAHAGAHAGGGGPWWLNPPPWWLPPPPEWGSPPPSVYSPFYSPYSISQPQGMNPAQNHAPAYTPTPLPYFFLQMGEPVVEKYPGGIPSKASAYKGKQAAKV